ncbi:MAG: DUF4111 domain-containing protein [Fusicatenibacter sp.]|nr:DUF4111 domain-containing protein [Fusicatenibacter sp.]
METVLNRFLSGARQILKSNLIGIYLHGSAVMGCYNPAKSDIDLITVVKEKMTPDSKRAFMDMVVNLNELAPAKGIEMSIVTGNVCNPFLYPTPFELHFSVAHLAWYKENPNDYIAKMNGVDKDLAAHFTVILKRGKCLYGLPIEEVFGEVPREAYLDSIRNDIADARTAITRDTMYITLNLARVLAYQRDGIVISKKEGGEWALRNLSAEYHPLLKDALREYQEGAEPVYDKKSALNYAEYMLTQIASV